MKTEKSKATHWNARVLDALIDINTLYGRGEIIMVDFEAHFVLCRLQNGKKVYDFIDDAGVVRFRGHKRKSYDR